MIDTHAHLDSEEFDLDRDEVISRAFQNGIDYIIVPAIKPDNFDSVINLSKQYEKIFCGIGVHPHDADSFNSNVEKHIFELVENDNVKAIGEIGLDYFYNFSTPEVQKDVFRKQLRISKEINKPVIIHNRESDQDMLEILDQEQDGSLRGVLHCFSGNIDFLESILKLGLNVSFTGNVTFKKFENYAAIESLPMDRFMLETDSPYMTPVPNRGKRNEPMFVNLVANKISEIKKMNIKDLIEMTSHNAKKLFGIISVLLMIFLAELPLLAQSNKDETDQEYFDDEENFVNAYKKTLGFGLIFATNTIVEYYEPRAPFSNVSYEGLFSLGGTVQYSPFDFLILTGSYLFSKNNKLVEKYPDVANLKPNTHQQIELTSNFIINPNGRINFFGMVGFSYLMNEYGDPKSATGLKVDNQPGFNTGLGFYINIPIQGAGLFNIEAEWKLNFMLASTNLNFDPRIQPGKEGYDTPVQISSFFSMPRLSIIWFPEFLFE